MLSVSKRREVEKAGAGAVCLDEGNPLQRSGGSEGVGEELDMYK
jgi:hypothetical protein